VDDEKVGIRHLYPYGDSVLGGYDHIKPNDIVMLFESAIDRLAAESRGFHNCIDCGGAMKFSASHARLLKRKGVLKVLIIFDGDEAGRKGALEAGQLLVDEGIQVWVGELPEGTDPAQMLREQGKDDFLACLQQPKTYSRFKMYQELSAYSLEEIESYLREMKANERSVAEIGPELFKKRKLDG